MVLAVTSRAEKRSGATGQELLDAHSRSFSRLVRLAQSRVVSGRLEQAAALVIVAAAFAWDHHPGVFCSPELEEITWVLSNTINASSSGPPRRLRAPILPEQVLHVFTEAYAVGGHSRLASHWMALDTSRRHFVVTTNQRGVLPPSIRIASERSGGSVITLNREKKGLLETARQLAELADGFGLVVLHTHPSDALPGIAFAARRERPRVLLVNHADHVFWMGICVADLVICFRDSGRRLTRERRGIEECRLVDLPLPLSLPERRLTVEEAKRELSIEPDQLVLLTVASEYKFRTRGRPDFLDLVTPVVRETPNAVLLAVGPADTGRWREAAEQTGGRVQALGVVTQPFLHRHAADIYLDSTPFGSITSLLESAAMGTPALAYTPGRTTQSITFSDPPAVERALLRAGDPEAYRALLRRLMGSRAFRDEVGANLSAQVRDVHSSQAWTSALERVYQAIPETRGQYWEASTANVCPGPTCADYEVVALATGRHGPFALADTMSSLKGSIPGAMVAPSLVTQSATRLLHHAPLSFSPQLSVPARLWYLFDHLLVR